MHRNILIISDNIYLSYEFEKIIFSSEFQMYNWNFSISSSSNKNDFSSILKSKINKYDLKNRDEVNTIIELYDLVISIHCKQIFPENLVNNVKCINIHPGYNPINIGWYPQVFAIINNLSIRATIHEIDNELDNGNIIDREFVKKEVWDTSLSLYDKILKKELELIKKNLINILQDCYKTQVPENIGNLFLKKDFNELCKIDLDEKLTMRQAIDKLRALTHGEFANAYFIEPSSKRKIFVSIEFKLKD